MKDETKLRCIICGTTENVNFEGKCYEDSIVIHENTEESREEFENETTKIILEKSTLIKITFFILIIVLCIIFKISYSYSILKNENSNLTTKYMNSQSDLKKAEE